MGYWTDEKIRSLERRIAVLEARWQALDERFSKARSMLPTTIAEDRAKAAQERAPLRAR